MNPITQCDDDGFPAGPMLETGGPQPERSETPTPDTQEFLNRLLSVQNPDWYSLVAFVKVVTSQRDEARRQLTLAREQGAKYAQDDLANLRAELAAANERADKADAARLAESLRNRCNSIEQYDALAAHEALNRPQA